MKRLVLPTVVALTFGSMALTAIAAWAQRGGGLPKEQPILSGKLTRCPDAIADVMKDGTFIAGCEPRETASSPDYYGMSALMISRDHGQTWGPVVQLISDYQLNRFAPGLKPVSGGFPKGAPDRVASNSPWDRPYTTIDDSTGVIYAVAQGGSAYADDALTERRSQAYITASTDGGKSFGTVYSWDSPEFVQASRGVGEAAAFGVVAVTFTASKVPASEGPPAGGAPGAVLVTESAARNPESPEPADPNPAQ